MIFTILLFALLTASAGLVLASMRAGARRMARQLGRETIDSTDLATAMRRGRGR